MPDLDNFSTWRVGPGHLESHIGLLRTIVTCRDLIHLTTSGDFNKKSLSVARRHLVHHPRRDWHDTSNDRIWCCEHFPLRLWCIFKHQTRLKIAYTKIHWLFIIPKLISCLCGVMFHFRIQMCLLSQRQHKNILSDCSIHGRRAPKVDCKWQAFAEV
jgi:hypothetical protein